MRILAIVAAIVMVCLGPLLAHQRPEPQRTVPPEQLDARQFLYGVYPELRDRALWVEMGTAREGIRIRVVSPLATPLASPVEVPQALLSADFGYGRDLSLTTFRASGPYLRSDENQRLRARLLTARDPSAALADERTRFGIQSGAVVSTEAPIEAIGRSLGTISIGLVTLKAVAGETESAYGAVWEMAVVAQKANASAAYALQFEPYSGRLVGLKRQ